jgi:hypothetical protein
MAFALLSGCLSSFSPTENLILDYDMTIEDFLGLNGLAFELATEVADTNNNGVDDLYTWDLDGDNKVDVVVGFSEEIKTSSHGSTFGFHKIIIYNYKTNEVLTADVGKNSGRVRTIYTQALN